MLADNLDKFTTRIQKQADSIKKALTSSLTIQKAD